MTISCPHLVDRRCKIASQLAFGYPVQVQEDACGYCSSVEPSRDVNLVTVSLASNELRNQEAPDERAELHKNYGHFLRDTVVEAKLKARLSAVAGGKGVGSQLWNLLSSLGISHSANCPCLTWAEQMNLWGPEGCEENAEKIVGHMRRNADKYKWRTKINAALKLRVGLALRLNPLNPYKGLLKESINLARQAA